MKQHHLLTALLLATPYLATADVNILANGGTLTAPLKPTITISDSYSDKLVRFFTVEAFPADTYNDDNDNGKKDTGETYNDDNGIDGTQTTATYKKTYTSGLQTTAKLSAKIVVTNLLKPDESPVYASRPVSDTDTVIVDETTPVFIKIGDFSFQGTLGDEDGRGVFTKDTTIGDQSYSVGDKKPFLPTLRTATFKIGYSMPDLDANFQQKLIKDPTDPTGETFVDAPEKFVQTGSLLVDWSGLSASTVAANKAGKTLTITYISAVTYNEGDEPETFWTGRMSELSLKTISKFVNQPIPVEVTFGEATGQRLAYANGVTKARQHRARGEATPKILHSVSLIGAADTVAPVVKFAPAAAADPELAGVDFLGTVQDIGAATYPTLMTEEDANGLVVNVAPKLELTISGSDPILVPYTDLLGNPLTSLAEGIPTELVPNEAGYYNSTQVLNSLGLGNFGGFADLSDVYADETKANFNQPVASYTIILTATDADGNATVTTKTVKGVVAPDVFNFTSF